MLTGRLKVFSALAFLTSSIPPATGTEEVKSNWLCAFT